MTSRRLAALFLGLTLLLTGCEHKSSEPQQKPDVSADITVTEAVTEAPETTSEPTEAAVTTTVPETTAAPATTTTLPVTTAATTTVSLPATTPAPQTTVEATTTGFTVEAMTATMYTTMSLNVRVGPSTEYDKIGSLSEGKEVAVTGKASTGWYRISFKGGDGYVSGKYLTENRPEPPKTEATTTATVKPEATEATTVATEAQKTSNVPEVRTKPTEKWNGISLVPIYENGMEYLWSQLSNNDKDNVAVMMDALSKGREYCELKHPVKEDLIWEYVHFVHDYVCGYTHVDFYNYRYWVKNGDVIAVEFNYVFTGDEAKKMNDEVQKKIDEIIKNAPDTSERDRIKYFHDYVIKNCTYSYEGKSTGTPYGSLIEGKAVCQGYAHAMQMLLSRAGFDAIPAIGEADGGYHKWNYVRLSDGKWYVIDATWDDPIGMPEDYISYDYFMITDKKVEEDHSHRYGSRFFTMPTAE